MVSLLHLFPRLVNENYETPVCGLLVEEPCAASRDDSGRLKGALMVVAAAFLWWMHDEWTSSDMNNIYKDSWLASHVNPMTFLSASSDRPFRRRTNVAQYRQYYSKTVNRYIICKGKTLAYREYIIMHFYGFVGTMAHLFHFSGIFCRRNGSSFYMQNVNMKCSFRFLSTA